MIPRGNFQIEVVEISNDILVVDFPQKVLFRVLRT